MPSEKLVFLTTGLAYGGAETQLVRVAMELKARGWRICVVSMRWPQAYAERLRNLGIPVHTLGMRPGVADPRGMLRWLRFVRREQPTIVTSFMYHANLFARITRPLGWVPVLVSSARNVDERGKGRPAKHRELSYRLTDRFCDYTVQNSHAGLDRYVRIGAIPRLKGGVIPNGIDPMAFQRSQELRDSTRFREGLGSLFVWLAVGRLERQKDYPTMIRAFATVVKQQPQTCLLIAGDGDLRPEIERLARRLDVDDRVRFLGVRTDVHCLMNAADAYVMSSAWEGMPNVLLEAGATQLPIVATDVGGVGEVVLDGETGFLVRAMDSAALGERMVHLMMRGESARLQMGMSARRHIEEHFDIRSVTDRWESLFEDLLEQRRRRASRSTGGNA